MRARAGNSKAGTASARFRCQSLAHSRASLSVSAALAIELKAARDECGGNDRAFGVWLAENGCDDLSAHQRAAVIKMAEHIEVAREVLESTNRRSLEHIWRSEISIEVVRRDLCARAHRPATEDAQPESAPPAPPAPANVEPEPAPQGSSELQAAGPFHEAFVRPPSTPGRCPSRRGWWTSPNTGPAAERASGPRNGTRHGHRQQRHRRRHARNALR
jgi:hypothetical protein